jgi:hypothetical protein
MIDPPSFILGVALGVAVAMLIEVLYDRRQRGPADLAELRRHQAVPTAPPAYTGDTARLAPYGAQPTPDQEIAGRRWSDPLPDDLPYGKHTLHLIARGQPRRRGGS